MRASGLDGRGVVVYDGDTPGDARRAARERTGIVLTNPDMLHAGILPHHTAWARTFQNLEYVVVDELHTYQGVFGSHVANVLRRLMRVARFHGSNPVLIGATATIGNPREHAARLFGLDADEDVRAHRPRAARRRASVDVLPLQPARRERRARHPRELREAGGDARDRSRARARADHRVRRSRATTSRSMLRYLRDKVAPDIEPSRIMGYRGGYLPEQRREIERKLRARRDALRRRDERARARHRHRRRSTR